MAAGFSSPDELGDNEMFAQAPGAAVGTLDDLRTNEEDRDSGISDDPRGEIQSEVIGHDQEILLRQAREALKDPRE
ncbi:MAG: hypothetical protein PHE68_03160 [Candidatus Peribacteraceae bacterium]|nr:hypothetical protein [Candidatus Peribacteraceae bacterium]MDD5075118.1 hypothetical protein [Candidatus Peribacteraceae bacterium]